VEIFVDFGLFELLAIIDQIPDACSSEIVTLKYCTSRVCFRTPSFRDLP